VRIFGSMDDVPNDFGPSAVTIGKFDGVHSGHRRVIGELREIAAEHSLLSTVVTFDRHPLTLLKPEIAPAPLVSLAQKVELLGSLGVDATLVLTFDEELSQRSPQNFVQSILVDTLHVKVVLVGSDFRFGARGAGDITLLREMGTNLGFEVRVVDDVRSTEGRRASSTWIRELLAEGRVSEAGELLGYPPCVRAIVVHGEKRGRELGYPTANLAPSPEGLIPADGVYAAWATIGEDRFPAAVSVGNNPTFDGVPEKRVEAHLLDQDLDLYGRTIEIAFVEYVRGMVKFTNIDGLIAQMDDDTERVRAVLGVRPPV
jgi:riboflavin kinase/FMN adenylyltransferase